MIYLLPLILLLNSCSDSVESDSSHQRGEFITRKYNEFAFAPPYPKPQERPPYPWEKPLIGNHPLITTEYFRCKGSSLNPGRVYNNGSETTRIYDCGGAEKHSLPLRNGKDFIYPILLELVNYIQAQTGKRVVITCGHRCPEHNIYSDPSPPNQQSKHMIGAEVSFYVQGMETQPEKIINIIQKYYKEKHTTTPFTNFERYEKGDTDVSTLPWYNKEVFIKLFKPSEGRNMDNRHPYPYISIQVRYDTETKQRIQYNWNDAYKNYLRK